MPFNFCFNNLKCVKKYSFIDFIFQKNIVMNSWMWRKALYPD